MISSLSSYPCWLLFTVDERRMCGLLIMVDEQRMNRNKPKEKFGECDQMVNLEMGKSLGRKDKKVGGVGK